MRPRSTESQRGCGFKQWGCFGWAVLPVLLSTATPTQAVTRYVNAARPDDNGDGLSWATAKRYLQSALTAAGSGDQIWVAAGIYKPYLANPPACSSNLPACSFELKNGVRLYGGFPATGNPTIFDRNITANPTILDGDRGHPPAVDTYHVVTGSNTDSTAVLNGFTIRNGVAIDAGGGKGGGLYIQAGSPSIEFCTFQSNYASQIGGAVACDDGSGNPASPRFYRCTFISNTAAGGSQTDGSGGAIHLDGIRATIDGCTFLRNKATLLSSGSPAAAGGAVASKSSSPVIRSCTFIDNYATKLGGAMSVWSTAYNGATPIPVEVSNCTIVGNTTDFKAAGVWFTQTEGTIANSILWGNTDPGSVRPETSQLVATSLNVLVFVKHNCIQGLTSYYGEPAFNDNFDQAPLLTPDGHLRSISPCINRGNNTFATGTIDCDGETRIQGGIVDVGSDEWWDSDIDGLPNWWEARYSTATTAGNDTDGDGETNISEYERYGTNPIAAPRLVPSQYSTISAAVSAAAEGDTIRIAPGAYFAGNYNLSFFGKTILLRGAGAFSTVIDCGGSGRLINPDNLLGAFVTAQGMRVVGGSATQGGAIFMNQSRGLLWNCILDLNSATAEADSLYVEYATPTINNLTLAYSAGASSSDAVFFWSYVNLDNPNGGLELSGTGCRVDSFSSWFYGLGRLNLGDGTVLRIRGAQANALPTIIRSDVVGLGDIVIEAGQSLRVEADATIDLSGNDPDAGCADQSQSATWGTITINGLLFVDDNATLQNTNVDVKLADIGNGVTIMNNDIRLPKAAYDFGGEFFVDGNTTVQCNVITSEGDRYLDIDPDPNASPRPNIQGNKFYVIIKQGVNLEKGELLELRTHDYDIALFGSFSGAYRLAASTGYGDTWALEKLTIEPGAKVNLTNREGFDFDPDSVPEALYVKDVVLKPGAVLNTGFQRLYYQRLFLDDGAGNLTEYTATGQPPYPDPLDPIHGARIVDHPLLGFPLHVINFDDPNPDPLTNEFNIRVRPRLHDLDDIDPPFVDGEIVREEFPPGSGNYIMRMSTAPATNVAAKCSFDRAGEPQITVAFKYLFTPNPTNDAELLVYLSDSEDVSTNLVEIARVYPPASGPGSIGSGQFATFSGRFPRGTLNFTRGTYVELELRGADAGILIDDWDPVACIWCQCGDFSADCAVSEIDYLYLLSEYGSASNDFNNCADQMNPDNYVDIADLLAWSSMFHNYSALDLCNGPSGSAGGTSGPVPVGNSAVLIAGKPSGGAFARTMSQNDALYPVNSQTQNVGTSLPAPVENNGVRSGHGRLISDSAGSLHQVHGSKGLVRLTDGFIRIPQQTFFDTPISGSTLRVGPGISGLAGTPIADAAFHPTDPTIVYVVPVMVTPAGGNPYRAAAKLQMTTPGNYIVLAVYGANPASGSTVSCTYCTDIVYSPDVSRMREVEVDAYGNLFVASGQAVGNQDYVLLYRQSDGVEIPVSISTNVQGPAALHVKGDKLYVSTSIDGPDNVHTKIWRYTIQRSGNDATGLFFDAAIDVSNMRFVTDMMVNPADNRLWAIGYNADTCSRAECLADPSCPAGCAYNDGESLFCTPRVAIITNPTTSPSVTVSTLTGADLALPLSLLFTACGTGDFDGGGTGVSDIQPFVAALLNPSPSVVCRGDLTGDGLINGLDIRPFVDALIP